MKLVRHAILAFFCLLVVDMTYADEFQEQKVECSKDSSKKWNTKLNRCMTTVETKKNFDNYRNCTLFETKNERDKCMRDLVLEVSGDATLEDANWNELIMNAITTGISVSNLSFSKKKKSPCLSVKIAASCGGAAVLKEIYIVSKAKKETQENLEAFQEKVKDKDNYETQLTAYQSQIDQLNSLSKYYDLKQKLNKLTAACFGGAAAAAVMDIQKRTVSCSSVSTEQAKPDVSADTQPTPGASTGISDATPAVAKKFTNYLRSPTGVALLSLTNMGWNLLKAKKVQEQGDKAALLAKRAKVAKDQFITSMSNYCPKGHEDKSDLMCYCYEGGKKKSNRTNSKSCKDLWANADRNLFVDSSDKTRATANKAPKMGCITVAGEFDPKCQCQKFKDTQGNNACKKTNFSQVNLGGLGHAIDVKQLESDLNNITSGITAAQGFDLNTNQSKALGSTLRDQVLKQIKIQTPKGLETGSMKNLAAVEKDLLSSIGRNLGSAQSADAFSGELAEIQKKIEDSIEKDKKPDAIKKLKMVGGKGTFQNRKKKENFALNYNNSSGSVEQYPDYMKKSYKTKNADVVTNKDVSIFKVLSNRYYKSGFKRLFEE